MRVEAGARARVRELTHTHAHARARHTILDDPEAHAIFLRKRETHWGELENSDCCLFRGTRTSLRVYLNAMKRRAAVALRTLRLGGEAETTGPLMERSYRDDFTFV